MPAYTDHSFYTTTYLGTTLTSTEFPRLALRASAIVDQVTFGRAVGIVEAGTDTDTIEKIKLATCGIAELVKQLDKVESGGAGEIASERVGNHSVSYVQNATSQMSDDEKLSRVAKIYLWDTDLMYQGITSP